MNRVSLYVLLIFIFLGVSTSFSPEQKGAPYIANQQLYGNFFKGSPISVILMDAFTTGFLIKSYYHKYKVIHGFKSAETHIVRTSKKFWDANSDNLGMSIFRRKEGTNEVGTIPMPPGSVYIGDLAFGSWKWQTSGDKAWKFHHVYRNYPKLFGWSDDFAFTLRAYKVMKVHEDNNTAFYGLNQEFGTKGDLTQEFLKLNTDIDESEFNWKDYLKGYVEFPKKRVR